MNEEQMQELGKDVLDRLPPDFGYMLIISEPEKENLSKVTWVSNCSTEFKKHITESIEQFSKQHEPC